jgi:chemotaxis protein MotA
MFAIIGIVVTLVLVFGTYVVAGGSIGVIMHALPIEMTVIGGAAIGSTLVGNSMGDIKSLGGAIGKAFKGPKYNRQDFLDVIFLVSKLMKMLRTDGPVAVEPHIEDPKASAIFAEYPKLLKDDTLIHLICDTLRLVVVSSGTLDPHAVEEVMDNAIKTNHHHSIAPANNLQTLADALPALGIVAAVLGVVKTMASIDQPPAILGGMVASALVGTFLGVLLAYGIFGPFANRAKQVIEADGAIYDVVKQIVIASLHGHPLPLVIEAARSGIAHANQPAFADVFDGMRGR